MGCMTSEPSDWDPLPEQETSHHPGEAPRFTVRPGVERISVAEPATVLGTVPTAVEARPPASLAVIMEAPARPRPAIQRIAKPEGPVPGEKDPREDEPWFRALPAVEQRRLAQVWVSERQQAASATDNRRRELLEWFWVAYVVFFVAALPLMLVEGLSGFVRMAMAGCVTGLVWQAVPRSRSWCVGSAVSVYLLITVVPRTAELLAAPFDAMVALAGAVLVGYLSSLGAMHEQLRVRQTPA